MKRKTIFLNLLAPVLLLICDLAAGTGNLQFDHITIEQGLSSNAILCMLQDSQGFIWIGTLQGGLNRYDGVSFKIYTHDHLDPNSISGNTITAIHEDRMGKLWIATTNGLNRFNRHSKAFLRFQHNPDDPNSISDNLICSLSEDRCGGIWIGTHNRGLNKFDPKNLRFKRFVHDPDNPNSLSHNHISVLHTDKKGQLWIGTGGGGLNKFNIDSKQWTRYLHDSGDPLSLSHNTVSAIFEDKKGDIWIGTLGGGLNKCGRESGIFTRYIGTRSNQTGLRNNYIFSILEDRDNRLWIGTAYGVHEFIRDNNVFIHHHHVPGDSKSFSLYSAVFILEDHSGLLWMGSEAGINLLDKNKLKFAHLCDTYSGTDIHITNSLSHNHVEAIHESQDGILWIGTWGGGLNAFDRKSKRFTFYKNRPEIPQSISSNMIACIHEENSGNLWIGTKFGLNYFDRKARTFSLYQHNPENPNSLGHNIIWSIAKDKEGMLWIGTGIGLDKFNPWTKTFQHFRHDPENEKSLGFNSIKTLLFDRHQNLWIGTWGGGLNRLNEKENAFYHFTHDPRNSSSLSNNFIKTIYETGSGDIWIGTTGGLNLYNPENDSFQSFSKEEGLPHYTISGILEDEYGNLWISTNRGISKFNPVEKSFRNYDFHDGLQNAEFTSACYKTLDGEMFFGGMHGFNSFNPDRIVDNPFVPPIFFTSFSIYSHGKKWKEIEPTDDRVTLSYRDTLSVRFSALSYANPSRNQYAYRINKLQRDWINLGNQNKIILAGMEPGEYSLQIKGSSHCGVWNHKGISIKLIVSPPFWKTWWFRILMILILISSVFVWHQSRMKNLAHRLKTETVVSQFLTKHDISNREREILKLLLKGKSNKEIENILFISPHTVKNHVYHIFQKLNIKSRGQLLALFQEYLVSREAQ